ncbi:MAG: hypothetical protein ACYSUI_18570 [Planctomycetota bacterium]
MARAPARDMEDVALGPESVVVGSLVRGPVTTIVVDLPADPATAMQEYEDTLEQRGWESGPPRGGFQGFRRATDPRALRTYCREGTGYIGVQAAGRTAGGTRMLVRLQRVPRAPGGLVCDASLPPRERNDYPIPDLVVPADADWRGQSAGGSSDQQEWAVRLRTELTAAELLAHFGPQLEAEGWAPATEIVGGLVTAQAWRRTTDDGRQWHLLLFAFDIPAAANEREVGVRVTAVGDL